MADLKREDYGFPNKSWFINEQINIQKALTFPELTDDTPQFTISF